MIHEDADDRPGLTPETVRRLINQLHEQSSDGQRIVDCRAALERLGGDCELFLDLVGFYFSGSPRLISEIDASVQTANAAALRRSAHALKGLLSNFDASGAVRIADELESMGREQALAGAAAGLEQLKRETAKVTAALARFQPSESPPNR